MMSHIRLHQADLPLEFALSPAVESLVWHCGHSYSMEFWTSKAGALEFGVINNGGAHMSGVPY